MLLRLLLLLALSASLRAAPALQERVTALPAELLGPVVRTGDGALWAMDPEGGRVSRDEGKTWERRTIFDAARFASRPERAFFRTKEGVLLYAFLNAKELAFKWDDAKGGPLEGCRLPVYVSRSPDDGRTWTPPVLLQEGWCGAVRQMIQLRSGRVLLVSQVARANPGRHVTIVYYSDDQGVTWTAGDVIDLGEDGNYRDPIRGITAATHGGGIEGTVLEKKNGDLRLVLRVPHGCFFEFNSRDGVTWTPLGPSALDASDSPATMLRLASGRVAMVWNRFRDPVKRLARRDQLWLAFSENDGVTWSTPQVIAENPTPAGQREAAFWISYPYLFEAEPGRLWISTMQGRLNVTLAERDFVAPVAAPLSGPAVRIITLGDSITRGARPGVLPLDAFPGRLQAGLREAGHRVEVHNVGIGGDRVDGALARLERDVIAQRPHLVTVMYGTNDSWVDRGKTESRISVERYEADLRTLVRRLQAAGIAVVLMTEPMFGEQQPRNGADEDPNLRLGRYVERCRAVARELGVPLVDHFSGWAEAQRQGRTLQAWTTDGCHPNAAGHADLAARLLPVVAPKVAELSRRL